MTEHKPIIFHRSTDNRDREMECDFNLPQDFVWSIAASRVAYFGRVGDLDFIAPGKRFWANNHPFYILRHIEDQAEVRRLAYGLEGGDEKGLERLEILLQEFDQHVWVEVSTD
jgi:hypothetical protein